MKIKVVIPNRGMDRETLDRREEMLRSALSSETELSVDCIKQGPLSIESNTDEMMAGQEVLRQCVDAERAGFDAVVIYCFSDVGIEAVRENVKIPVVGPGEVSLAAADLISQRFTVVTTLSGNVSRTERRLMKNKVAREKMISVRALDIPVVELRENPDVTQRYLERLCKKSIVEDRIDTLILGCLGMARYGDLLEQKYGIKVIDPAFLAVGYAEFSARLRLVPSGRAYTAFQNQE